MAKRQFLSAVAGGAGLMIGSVLVYRSNVRTLYRKVKGRLMRQSTPDFPPVRRFAQLPREGEMASVELALNSRCSSDYDGESGVFHWGMFDGGSRLSEVQIARIAGLAGRCRFSDNVNSVEIDGNTLTFLISEPATSDSLNIGMVGSGVQQQAACLACAALGIGMMFDALGPDGRTMSSGKFAAVRMCLDPAKPSYRGSHWTAATPDSERPWLPGNLPEPRRDGTTPLVKVLQDLSLAGHRGNAATRAHMSQLLWSARGRTPHLYKSRPWGMTIPAWQGLQDISAVYIAAGTRLYRYVNWYKGRPTHSLGLVSADSSACLGLRKAFSPWNCFMILATDDPHARGLWEIGYQLLNVLVQAAGLGVACQTVMLQDKHREAFAGTSVKKPIVVVAFSLADEELL